MKQIKINGNNILEGTINIGGAKNSAVALVPASILSDDEVVINNLPNISDINALTLILNYLNVKVDKKNNTIKIKSTNLINKEIPKEIAQKLRASYYFMSALLGKYKHVEMYFPGGCSIGARPIDQTLKAFKLLGANIKEQNDKFTITANELIGNHIILDMPSVGATINTILVAVKAKGETTLENAAKEPEIVNLVEFLNGMGAKITGAGTNKIKIIGVEKLGKSEIDVIPDRIEAGTYIIAGALVGKNLKIKNIIPEHIKSLTDKLIEMNVNLKIDDNSILVSKSENLKPVNIKTLGYPGFPTDLQQPMVTLLTQANGISNVEETIYENRFQNIDYLNLMGSNIEKNKTLHINGKSNLIGKNVKATDLRAGACLILAGLIANGITVVTNVEHVLRGYENIIEKLTNVGAKIKIEEI